MEKPIRRRAIRARKKFLNANQYSIKIGATEVFSDLHATDADADEKDHNEKKKQEVLKEMRIRIGTLLKTDNVSFLIGAGASLSAGGFSLANIPLELEEALVNKAVKEDGDNWPKWLVLFYNTLEFLTEQKIDLDERVDLVKKDEGEEEESEIISPIKINLEDYFSVLYMWHSALGNAKKLLIRRNDEEKIPLFKPTLGKLIAAITSELSQLIDLPKGTGDDPLHSHQRFIKKVLTRPSNLRRANLFTLNYDTLIEQAADAEGAVLVDGFVGTLRRVFRPESYDLDFYYPAQTTEGRVHRFDRALHIYKLHGSITWFRCEQSWENPYGLYATYFNQDCAEDDVLIYPSPLKYGQAMNMPYSELFRRFGNSIAQPQSVLFVIGYGFGDEHVNALIRQALAIPSFTLVVISPNAQSSFVKQLYELEDERVWIVKGWELGTFERFVQILLPDLREEEIDAKVMNTYKALSRAKPDIFDEET